MAVGLAPALASPSSHLSKLTGKWNGLQPDSLLSARLQQAVAICSHLGLSRG